MDKKEKDTPKQAVALRYRQAADQAPRIVAKGRGLVAENILNVANQNQVPVYQNKVLTNMLMAVEIDREIPPALYQAVAEVLAYIYSIDQKAGRRNGE